MPVDAYGNIDKRAQGKAATARFTPIGTFDNLAVLYPYGGARVIGQLTTPVKQFAADDVDTAEDTITIAAHGWSTGAAVRFYSFDTLPTGLTAGTLYYLRAADAATLTVHATRAEAVANENAIELTAAGTGPHRVIEQEPLVITSSDGDVYTFHVGAVAQMPDLVGAATETLFGEVVFDLFRKAGVPATTADSLYTLSTGTYVPPSIDPAGILTQPYTFTWGSAPWAGLETVTGIRWSFPLTLEDVVDDANGVLAKRVTNVECTVRAQPLGLTAAAVMAKLLLQGTGAQRGGRLGTSDNFVMNGTGVVVTARGAGLRAAPQGFGRNIDRLGELEWFASRTFTAGAPNDLFTVAAA